MVRLKEKYKIIYAPRDRISIPYGAIKSTIVDWDWVVVNRFQFLMVRLKVSAVSTYTGI